jgi:ion channel-forming bestrophin family protein
LPGRERTGHTHCGILSRSSVDVTTATANSHESQQVVRVLEFLEWTRRKLYVVLALAIIPVVFYQLLGQKWIALPWSVAVLLGTATSFIVGFKNAQTYSRAVEAQQVWTAIASASRYWGTICRNFPTNPRSTRTLIQRHVAWLTAALSTARPPSLGERDQPRQH